MGRAVCPAAAVHFAGVIQACPFPLALHPPAHSHTAPSPAAAVHRGHCSGRHRGAVVPWPSSGMDTKLFPQAFWITHSPGALPFPLCGQNHHGHPHLESLSKTGSADPHPPAMSFLPRGCFCPPVQGEGALRCLRGGDVGWLWGARTALSCPGPATSIGAALLSPPQW